MIKTYVGGPYASIYTGSHNTPLSIQLLEPNGFDLFNF